VNQQGAAGVKVSETDGIVSAGAPVVTAPFTVKSANVGVPTGALFWMMGPFAVAPVW